MRNDSTWANDAVECPYCNKEQEVNHDDGYGYAEDVRFEQECSSCDRIFVFTTSVSFSHEAWTAPCLNGEEHDLRPRRWPNAHYPDEVRCEDCDYVDRGEHVNPLLYTPIEDWDRRCARLAAINERSARVLRAGGDR